MSNRTPLVIANWKLNGNVELLCNAVATFVEQDLTTQVGLCPPYLYIRDLVTLLKGSNVMVGSQNISEINKAGAFTGEISAEQAKSAGASLCLIGHSERREMFGETDSSCNTKVLNALESGLLPVLCVGENLEERQAGTTNDVIKTQLAAALANTEISGEDLCIAYEPVWAIGTGKAATPEDAQAVHAFIRAELTALYGAEKAEKVSVLYGGSANKNNASELMTQQDIDGLLVGGASLDPAHFLEICEKAQA